MCGFASIINLEGLKRDSFLDKKMDKALERLFPRGPNQSGRYFDNKCYMVHARLSIIDLSENAKQPFEKYNKVLIFNGEIYNFKELRNNLVKLGYRFTTSSDTEVLLAAWDKWGRKIVDYIEGMYAIAIWDTKENNLFLLRDPYGKKPLYYCIKDNIIAFASDLKSLKNIVDCGDINPAALESLFKLRFIRDPLTIYKNSFKLPPGHILEFSRNKKTINKWYKFPKHKNIIKDKKQVCNDLINLFDEAVKKRLISDVPLGVLLSGGIDSSLIVSSLAEQGRLTDTFTIGFEDASEYYEERPAAKRLSDYFGMKHHQYEVSSKNVIQKLPEIFQASDEPFADSSAIPFYILSEAVSKKITVAITGDGGDEVFGGYRKYLGEKWASLGNIIPLHIRNIISGLLRENKDTTYGEFSRRLRRFLLNSSFSASKRQAGWLEQLNEESINILLGKNIYNTETFLSDYRKLFDDPINSMLVADFSFSLPGDMLVKLDRMSMANSLEIRSPFLDKNLVEYAFNIPGNWKVGMFKGKKILREAFSNRMPDWSLNLPKKGFEIPIAKWLQTDLKRVLDDASSHKTLEKLGIVNFALIDEWKKDLSIGKRDTSWQLWTLIVYKEWASSMRII